MKLIVMALLAAGLIARATQKPSMSEEKTTARPRTYSETRADFDRCEFDGYNEIGAMG